ncbi:MAG: glycoside hydrolase family 5 protein [Phycisphaerae bacterium]
MHRREFFRKLLGSAAGAAMLKGRWLWAQDSQAPELPPVPAPGKAAAELAAKLPRWRGFNLLEKFMAHNNRPFIERDFQWIRQWGFDFARLPMSYHCWTDPAKPYEYDQKNLKQIDQAVAWGRQYGVHVSLNLHRAPGYTVARPAEKLDLWTSAEAQKQFNAQWAMFARRYKGISPKQLSFDLVNEPAKVESAPYARVAAGAIAAIRKVDPDRLVISDGLNFGRIPCFELVGAQVAQSTRGYEPFMLTHYKAGWVNSKEWPEPKWPGRRGQDAAWLKTKCIEPWQKLEEKGVGVHVGEWGSYNHTPHEVVLAWAEDLLGLWKQAGWGWGLWNLRGPFGVVDSKRQDVKYEDFQGHKLDKAFLELLQAN